MAKSLKHPLAAGENMRSKFEFDKAISSDVIGVVQPDVCKWGGVSGCLDIARRAIAAGKRYCPHFLGGGLGLVASSHLLSAAGGDGMLEIDVNENALREAFAGSLLPLSQWAGNNSGWSWSRRGAGQRSNPSIPATALRH